MIVKRPLVIDLSAWEHDTDWEAQAGDAPLLMITRLTLGKDYVDAFAGSHIEGARSIGSKVGVYHFLEYNDIQPQIDNFLEAAIDCGALVPGAWTLDVPPILDVEMAPSSNDDPQGASWAYQIEVWLDAVEAATGVRPWIYTNINYWKQTFDRNGNPPAWTNGYRLWVAQYFDQPDLHEVPSPLPAGWTDWILWQYSAAGIIPLCRYDGVDLNKASDQLLADLGATPEPPPTGEPTMKYKFVCQNAGYAKLNLWSDHSAYSSDVGDLLNGEVAQGDVLETLPNGEKWLAVKEVRGAPYPVQPAYVAVFYGGTWRGTLTENTTPPPPSDPVTVEVKVNGAVVYRYP